MDDSVSFLYHKKGGFFVKGSCDSLEAIYHGIQEQVKHQYAFVEMNIKFFLFFNAKYGNTYGEELLKKILQVMKTFLQGRGYIEQYFKDTFHFIVRYDETSKNVEENILQGFLYELVDVLFENEILHAHQNLFVSFGIVPLQMINHTDYEQLITMASLIRKNCPEIKHRTFSYEIYEEKIYSKYVEKQELAKRLTAARQQDEFEVYIQPKVNPLTNKIVAGEVLLRWKYANGMPLIEYLEPLNEFKEIYLVDLMQFRKACEYLGEGLRHHQPRVPLSFNISNVTILDREFIKDYFQVVKETGVPSSYIEFEFLEDIKFQQDQRIYQIFEECQKAGFRCSLDDFGAGNSSFAFLLNGAIDCIKLDRIFFQGPLDEKRKQILLRLMQIAKASNVDVVAEGVEDEEYVTYLKEICCEAIQGFYYYRPMPLKEFQALLDKQENEN